jgi:hypothetical protein
MEKVEKVMQKKSDSELLTKLLNAIEDIYNADMSYPAKVFYMAKAQCRIKKERLE